MKTFYFNGEIAHASVVAYGAYKFEVSGKTHITHDSEMYDYIDDEDSVKHQQAISNLMNLLSK